MPDQRCNMFSLLLAAGSIWRRSTHRHRCFSPPKITRASECYWLLGGVNSKLCQTCSAIACFCNCFGDRRIRCHGLLPVATSCSAGDVVSSHILKLLQLRRVSFTYEKSRFPHTSLHTPCSTHGFPHTGFHTPVSTHRFPHTQSPRVSGAIQAGSGYRRREGGDTAESHSLHIHIHNHAKTRVFDVALNDHDPVNQDQRTTRKVGGDTENNEMKLNLEH